MSGSLVTALASVTASVGVERLGWVLVHSLWQFCLIAAVAWALGHVLRQHSAATRYGMLVSLMTLGVLTPLFTLLALGPAVSAIPKDLKPAVTALSAADAAIHRDPPGALGARDTGTPVQPARANDVDAGEHPLTWPKPADPHDAASGRATAEWLQSQAIHALRPWLSTMVSVWCLGVFAFALRPALGWLMVRRLQSVGISAVDESVKRTWDNLKQRLAVRRRVDVIQSSLVDAPVVVGCFRSVILLPFSLATGLPDSQLEAILVHELAHVRRYDYGVNLLQTLIETLFFYHPCVWWLSHRIRVERENCCDDWVVHMLGDRLQYCRALLAVEESRRTATVLALGARDGSLLSRIQRISELSCTTSAPRIGSWSGVVFAGMALAGALWAMTSGLADAEAASDVGFGAESHGLRCRLVALSPEVSDELPDLNDTTQTFAQSGDMTFGVELKNVSSETLTLLGVRYGEGYAENVRGTLRTDLLAPHLFDFEFIDKEGKPVPRTHREYFSRWHMLLNASTHELKPGESLLLVLRPAKFHAPMEYDLPPGTYQVRVRYRGLDEPLPENVRKAWPERTTLGAWPHEVESNSIDISIEEGSRRIEFQDWVWGKPVEGLRAAVAFRLPDNVEGDPLTAPGVPLGTDMGVELHVQNVSDKPITFVSESNRQGDEVLITDEDGNKVEIESVWRTGSPIEVAWELAPGEVAQLPLLSSPIDALKQAGRYMVRYTVRFNSRVQKDAQGNVVVPRPGDFNREVDTGDTPLFLSDAPSPADEAQLESPFRLPDHWIIEDVRFVNNGKEIVTVSFQGGVNVRRWDVANRKLISEIKLASDQHGRQVRHDTLQLSADGERVLAATDEYVGIWDTATGDLWKRLDYPKKEWEYECVLCLDCSSDLSVVVAGLGINLSKTTLVYNGYGIVWDVASGDVKHLITHKNRFYFGDVAVSSDGKRFASCNEHGSSVCIWDTSSGQLLRDLSDEIAAWKSPKPEFINNNMVDAVAFSPDNKLLAISGTFGVRLVDSASGNLVRQIDAPYGFYTGSTRLVFSPDGSKIARSGAGREGEASGPGKKYSVPVWSTATGDKRYELLTEANAGAFSSDGTAIAVGISDFYEALSVWPLTGETVKSFSHPPTAYRRIDRVEENTHVRGKTAEEFVAQWKPVWGEKQHGIQYGIAFTVPTNEFHMGERVLMAAFLRNVGDKPQQIDLRPDMFGNLPQVISVTGEVITMEKRPLLGAIAHYRDTLQPGEAFGPLYLNFGLGKNPQTGLRSWEPFWAAPSPGRYKLTHAVPFQVAPPGVGGATIPWIPGKLTSGTLEFEVVDKEAVSAAKQSPPIDKAPTSKPAAESLPRTDKR